MDLISPICSIQQLQRKLDLARVSSRSTDDPEARARNRVRGQPHVYDVEDIEELGAELQHGQFRSMRAPAEWRVLDQRKVEVIKRRPSEAVARQASELSRVWTGAAGKMNRYREVRSILLALAEIILAFRARR